MGLGLWKRKHHLRRFKEPEIRGGHVFEKYEDIYFKADVQTTGRTTSTGLDGDFARQDLKVFSDLEMRVADAQTGVRADMLWHQGKWFECRSSRLSENTFLKHWTSTFVQCVNQPDPPKEG